jgi:hypothetical protein
VVGFECVTLEIWRAWSDKWTCFIAELGSGGQKVRASHKVLYWHMSTPKEITREKSQSIN